MRTSQRRTGAFTLDNCGMRPTWCDTIPDSLDTDARLYEIVVQPVDRLGWDGEDDPVGSTCLVVTSRVVQESQLS